MNPEIRQIDEQIAASAKQMVTISAAIDALRRRLSPNWRDELARLETMKAEIRHVRAELYRRRKSAEHTLKLRPSDWFLDAARKVLSDDQMAAVWTEARAMSAERVRQVEADALAADARQAAEEAQRRVSQPGDAVPVLSAQWSR